MHPALADFVQKTTRPDSTATTGERHSATMSFPSWPPCQRASPKSSEYSTGPTTGKMIRPGVADQATPALTARADAAARTRNALRAVGRCVLMADPAAPRSGDLS